MKTLCFTPTFLLSLCAAFTAAAAAVNDCVRGKIPNMLILAGLGVSAAVHILGDGLSGLLPFVTGLAPPLLLLAPAFLLRMTGAGDVKLLMVLGSFFGASGALRLLLAVFACGSVYALVRMARMRLFAARARYFLTYAADFLSTGVLRPYRQEGGRPENVRFGFPILLGTLLYIGGIF